MSKNKNKNKQEKLKDTIDSLPFENKQNNIHNSKKVSLGPNTNR